jgi:hypothetical protein
MVRIEAVQGRFGSQTDLAAMSPIRSSIRQRKSVSTKCHSGNPRKPHAAYPDNRVSWRVSIPAGELRISPKLRTGQGFGSLHMLKNPGAEEL